MKKDLLYYVSMAVIVIYMYLCNVMMPLSVGDDYVCSYIWDGSSGWNIYLPLPENARLIQSFSDLFQSLHSLYFTWTGRIVAHTLAQFFLWQGKTVFNFFNTIVFVLLLLEICWIANQGKITWKIEGSFFRWVFFSVWTFGLAFGGVVFWLVGSCNYLWTNVVLLGFLVKYIQQYFAEDRGKNRRSKAIWMFLAGWCAGWTNENTVCFWLLLLFIYAMKRHSIWKIWQWSGLAGFCLGYMLLIAAPGNYVRKAYEQSSGALTGVKALESDGIMLIVIFVVQVLLWFFILGNLYKKKQFGEGKIAKKYLCLIKAFCLISLGSLLIMLFAPAFPARAAFPSMLYLIIAAALVIQLQKHTGKNRMELKARYLLYSIGTVYLIISMSSTLYGYCLVYQQNQINEMQIDNFVQKEEKGIMQCSPTVIPRWITVTTTWHFVHAELEENPDDWKNVAYARYHGIEGAKLMESNTDTP